MKLELLYFAWVRERIGTGAQSLDVPDTIATVGDLLAWLAAQSTEHASALADRDRIRVAINQVFGDDRSLVGSGDEVAIFPPVTGG
jgi:sulfur-carrier protein